MTTTYRKKEPTFADLLQMAVASPVSGQASQPGMGGTLPASPESIQALEAQAFAPDPAAPPPAKLGLLQAILGGLGSVVGTYGSALAGGGPVDYLAPIRERLEQRRAEEHKANLGKVEAGRAKAQYHLTKAGKAEENKAAAALREKERNETNAYKQAQLEQTAAIVAGQRASEERDRQTRIEIEKMGNANRVALANAEKRLHDARVKGEGDKAQHAVYVQLKGAIVAKAGEYEQALAEGKTTPEKIVKEWQRIRKAVDLDPSGPYAAAADAFFNDEIGPLLMQYGPQQGPAVGPGYDKEAFAAGAGQVPLDTSTETRSQQGLQLLRRAP